MIVFLLIIIVHISFMHCPHSILDWIFTSILLLLGTVALPLVAGSFVYAALVRWGDGQVSVVTHVDQECSDASRCAMHEYSPWDSLNAGSAMAGSPSYTSEVEFNITISGILVILVIVLQCNDPRFQLWINRGVLPGIILITTKVNS
jgi:hypothetical protein